jgi:hypothetical protein
MDMSKTKTPGKKPQSKPLEDDDDIEGRDGEGGGEGAGEGEGTDPQEENRRLNAIVTSRVKREIKGVLGELAALKGLIEKISTPVKKDEDDGEGEGGEGEGGEGEGKKLETDKTAKKLSRLEKQLAEEKDARKAAEKAREEEAEKAKKTEMRNLFGSLLTEFGCTDPRLNRAALVILEEEGIMVRDEDGKIRFKGVDKYGIETLFDPKAGLKEWIAKDGKSFVPAVDAGGSGQGGSGQGIGIGNTRFTAKDLKNLSPKEIAQINFDRSFQGLPPLPGSEEA